MIPYVRCCRNAFRLQDKGSEMRVFSTWVSFSTTLAPKSCSSFSWSWSLLIPPPAPSWTPWAMGVSGKLSSGLLSDVSPSIDDGPTWALHPWGRSELSNKPISQAGRHQEWEAPLRWEAAVCTFERTSLSLLRSHWQHEVAKSNSTDALCWCEDIWSTVVYSSWFFYNLPMLILQLKGFWDGVSKQFPKLVRSGILRDDFNRFNYFSGKKRPFRPAWTGLFEQCMSIWLTKRSMYLYTTILGQ